jgi:hypothetical protein
LNSTNELPPNSEIVKKPDVVMQALVKLAPNNKLQWLLQTLACFILVLIAGMIIYNREAGTVMYVTGLAAASLSLFAFHHLMKLLPQTFHTLWNRKVIANRTLKTSTEANLSSLENQYAEYIDKLRSLMNHWGQWAMGLLFTLLVFTWDWSSVIEFFIAFVIGLMAWRMIVISYSIFRLGKKFCLKPQSEHDDGCGGLEPLGNLCLWNILIVAIPGIFLGGWIIVGQSAKYSLLSESYTSLAGYYTPLFLRLLLIPLAYAIISFVLPLWSVHHAMESSREVKQQELDQLSYEIDQLEAKLLSQVDKLDPQESEKMIKKLELMQQTYQKNRSIPVWPFNTRIIVKFATSQAVPVLGLTGLSQPILKVIGSLADFLR